MITDQVREALEQIPLALRDTVAALADLADAQAQRVEEWRQDYRALEGAHRVMREANARLIAERDAQAQENARLRAALKALERASAEVSRRGAQTGPQWPKLSFALISARAALGGTP